MGTNTSTVRIPTEAKEVLKRIAHDRGVPMQELVLEMIAEVERQDFFDKTRLAYYTLRNDPGATKTEAQRQDDLEDTLMDGIEDLANERQEPQMRRSLENTTG